MDLCGRLKYTIARWNPKPASFPHTFIRFHASITRLVSICPLRLGSLRGCAHSWRFVLGLSCSLWLLTSGCASSSKWALNYGDNARKAYAEALDNSMMASACRSGRPSGTCVGSTHLYSLRRARRAAHVADCQYHDGKFAEAIQSYEQFVRYRPSHVEVPYARFMIALAHFDQIPSSWLLSPPAYERRQHFTHDALRLLRRFIVDNPRDPLVPRAERMAKRAIRQLAAHLSCMSRGSIWILTTLWLRLGVCAHDRSYPTSGYEPEALLLLGETYLDLKDTEQAKRAFQEDPRPSACAFTCKGEESSHSLAVSSARFVDCLHDCAVRCMLYGRG